MPPQFSYSFEASGVVADKASGESDTRCNSSLTWRWIARYCKKNAIVAVGVMAIIEKYGCDMDVMWKVRKLQIMENVAGSCC
jgi:hypothetical protein